MAVDTATESHSWMRTESDVETTTSFSDSFQTSCEYANFKMTQKRCAQRARRRRQPQECGAQCEKYDVKRFCINTAGELVRDNCWPFTFTRNLVKTKPIRRRMHGVIRPCLPCKQRKIACDNSRPCTGCQARNCCNCCIDRATVMDLGAPLIKIALNCEVPYQPVAMVPRDLRGIWLYGFRRFSHSAICRFLQSNRW